MRKVISTVISLILILNVAMGYTSTVTVKGIGLTVTGDEGSVVEIEPKTQEVTVWEVMTGNTTVTDNQFIMPAGDVEIEGVAATQAKSLLTIEFLGYTKMEEKKQGVNVTINAAETAEDKTFSHWTSSGVALTAEQKGSATITFKMPSNAVTLIANYV